MKLRILDEVAKCRTKSEKNRVTLELLRKIKFFWSPKIEIFWTPKNTSLVKNQKSAEYLL